MELVSRYKAALKAYYPGQAILTYAGKAFLCATIADWANKQGLWVDCSGEAEISTAIMGGVPAASLLVHGVNKSSADLSFAAHHAGTIVVDNHAELDRLSSVLKAAGRRSRSASTVESVWLRLRPGIAVRTHHAYTETGGAESKFGLTPAEMIGAARAARSAGLPLDGLHFHQGSNFRDASPVVQAIHDALALCKKLELPDAWHFSPGGGWGVAYREDELPNPDVEGYVRNVAEAVTRGCRANGISLPTLHLEPGRSIMARAAVAIYRVGTIKRQGHHTWLLIDGGIADNPRPALYGSRYSCLPATGLARELAEEVSIGGPYCESGDVLIDELLMPRLEEGELIVIPVSGAYHLSMASNYNGACRPAVLWIERGRGRLIVRRETASDIRQRDVFAQ